MAASEAATVCVVALKLDTIPGRAAMAWLLESLESMRGMISGGMGVLACQGK